MASAACYACPSVSSTRDATAVPLSADVIDEDLRVGETARAKIFKCTIAHPLRRRAIKIEGGNGSAKRLHRIF